MLTATIGWIFVGIAIGVLLAVPAAWLWSRRTAARVQDLERRSRTSERLAELGTMTGGLAHEIKNPLSTVGLNIQLIQEDIADARQAVGDAHPARDALDRVTRRLEGLHRETQRLRNILEDFLRFAGRMKLDRVHTDLNGLVHELTDFFEPQADASGVRVHVDAHAAPAIAAVDVGLVKQAVLNLMLNAVQAIERDAGGGDTTRPRELLIRTARRDDELALQIADTGPGMEPEVLARIFEPYFSGRRGGSGLGLPTTRRIIEEHGGTITATSTPGKGTEFTLRLPALTDATDAGLA